MIDGIRINPIKKANKDIIDRLKNTKNLLENGYEITYRHYADFQYRFGEYVGLKKISRIDAFMQKDRPITENERKAFIEAITYLIDKLQNEVIKLPIEQICIYNLDFHGNNEIKPNLDLIRKIEKEMSENNLGDDPNLNKMLSDIIKYIDQREK